MIDLRFSTALQLVLALAVAHEIGARCTSVELVAALGANPVLVRRLMMPLAQAGIVVATLGKNGGVRLARQPEDITLQDVYAAVLADKKFLKSGPNWNLVEIYRVHAPSVAI